MAKEIIVHGRVQGVFFRDYTRKKALQLGLKGYVRNMPDGTVKVVVEDGENVQELVDWLENEGSPSSKVQKVEINETDLEVSVDSFQILH